ncbi:uncharacterized protein BKCO1_2600054 [Diplodia corticola]|uniref:Uncharacterized protein n=1 Tax=Diplodia corticola TaxID=236234 RepID=A0A1J9S305_9PEZI|nr:uncharacterized protein BKCO1_2600054 [Diplodia corticola]OJD34013.1 hypothetical protein BKCO1_2600054 [Diplodia corticola]
MIKGGGIIIGVCVGVVAFVAGWACFWGWLRSAEEEVEVQAVLGALELDGMQEHYQQRRQSMHRQPQQSVSGPAVE